MKEKIYDKIPYEFRVHKRVRGIRLTIHYDGRVVVTAPSKRYVHAAEKFVQEKKSWIKKNLPKYHANTSGIFPSWDDVEAYSHYQKSALAFVKERVQYFNSHYSFPIGHVRVRNHRSQWGSCSTRKNIHFNYRILFLPKKLADYVIIHEICHVHEMNHSARFWSLVAKLAPDHKSLERALRGIRFS